MSVLSKLTKGEPPLWWKRNWEEFRRPRARGIKVSLMAVQGCVLSLWLSLLLPVLLRARAAEARWRGEGTTPHLQSIFLGRCAEYTTLLSLQDKNCTAIWEAFKVVLDKDPCSVLPSDYDLFINLSKHSLPRDKSLFWENNHLLVMSFSENTRRLTPLCDVLYGKVGDFLSWCRQENASGLDYQSCPTSEDCEDNAVDSYWRSASMQGGLRLKYRLWLTVKDLLEAGKINTVCKSTVTRATVNLPDFKYSRDSSGVINVMLNGSDPKGAYPTKGFFADFEIPYLQKDKVTRIEIWVMHEVGGPNVESCGEGSVKILEDRLEALGFQHSCINDYRPVKFLMCVDHSTHPDCVMNSASASLRRERSSLRAIGDASLIISLLVALATSSQV